MPEIIQFPGLPDTSTDSASAQKQLFKYIEFANATNVPVPVRALEDARVIWLNRDWFERRGIDTDNDLHRQTLELWLDSTFGVCTLEPNGKPVSGQRDSRFASADRYGGTGGAPHGGSGRCINAKGVGPTPLVPQDVSHAYRHGFLQMSQAIKQTVCSLIAEQAFPHSALPVIAVLDTGLSFQFDADQPKERCGIVVRPNIIRAAHFERSVYFGTAGTPDADQHLDAQRVESAVGFTTSARFREITGLKSENVAVQFLERACAQLGTARAKRFWGDAALTSNIGIDGAWCDLELFQTLPSFGRGRNQVNNLFGAEAAALVSAFNSLSFYFRKFGDKDAHPMSRMDAKPTAIERKIMNCFVAAAKDALLPAGHSATPNIQELDRSILALYRIDQSRSYDAHLSIAEPQTPSQEFLQLRQGAIENLEHRLAACLGGAVGDSEIAAKRVRNFLAPRPSLFGAPFRSECLALVNDVYETRHANEHDIAAFIDERSAANEL